MWLLRLELGLDHQSNSIKRRPRGQQRGGASSSSSSEQRKGQSVWTLLSCLKSDSTSEIRVLVTVYHLFDRKETESEPMGATVPV